jgi:2-polyprenyl-6-methoxyphenol hydroxylase-like FAD-dependent oxidoreductase
MRTAVLFEVEGASLAGIDGPSPRARYRHGGDARELVCDCVAGCDGFHGISRDAIPRQALRVQDFSSWMSTMLHRLPGSDGFFGRLQQAQREYLCRSQAGARSLAANHVGLPHELD